MKLQHLVYMIALATLFSRSEAADVNQMPPVYTDRQAVADYAVVHDGVEVRFCCSECIIAFKKDPDACVADIPQFRNMPLSRQ